MFNNDKKLIKAVNAGDPSKVKKLCKKVADLEIKDYYGNTPLIIAAERGYTACVKALILAGADVNSEGVAHYTPLIWSARKGHKGCLKILIKSGADLNKQSSYGYTALISAASKGHTDCLEELLEAGAKLDMREKNNSETAVMVAAQEGHSGCVQKLIEAGADLTGMPKQYQEKYAPAIDEINKVEPDTYSFVNDYIVVQHKGDIKGVGPLRRMFDFENKLVFELINETPGAVRDFNMCRENPNDIMAAYDWVIAQGQEVAHPFQARPQTTAK